MPASSPDPQTMGGGVMPPSSQDTKWEAKTPAYRGIKNQELLDLINHPCEVHWENVFGKLHDAEQWKRAFDTFISNKDVKAKILLELICRQNRNWIFGNKIPGLSSSIMNYRKYVACNDQMMDSAIVHLLEDPTKYWKLPKFLCLKVKMKKDIML